MLFTAISIMNVVVMFTVPHELSSSMQLPLRVVHSALCTRVFLNLRKAAARTSGVTLGDFTVRETSLAFARPHSDSPRAHALESSDELELEDLGYYRG
ncbi:hypothetical protein C8Q76DRAFT_234919 [Earliella scabrosa]|nr:hypothetical protein C8Q76DRAFT_234919 [Earliella scabrosa]